MTASKIPPSHPRQLYVENKDMHAIIQLMAHHGCDWNNPAPALPYVNPSGSVEKALAEFRLALKGTGDRVGIVVDADVNAASRWDAVAGHLRAHGVNPPKQAPPAGWVGDAEGRRFGAWVMPDNVAPGKLEDFLTAMIPANDVSWPWARSAAGGARERGAPFREIDLIKAELSTWLAWRDPPGLPYGTAIHAQYLRFDAPSAAPFVAWFKRLFLEK